MLQTKNYDEIFPIVVVYRHPRLIPLKNSEELSPNDSQSVLTRKFKVSCVHIKNWFGCHFTLNMIHHIHKRGYSLEQQKRVEYSAFPKLWSLTGFVIFVKVDRQNEGKALVEREKA